MSTRFVVPETVGTFSIGSLSLEAGSNLEIPPGTKGRILVVAERSVNKGFPVLEFEKDNFFNNL